MKVMKVMKHYRDFRDAYHVMLGIGMTCLIYGFLARDDIPQIPTASFIVGGIFIIISLICVLTINHPNRS